ncbi:unnamed protein product [Adineta steineri]|uniref:NAD(P)-binding domain-containing protein n=1 Tax=Adineta steineri TaxID=433720 RepID=A0A819MG07_9BILA|nr:unnamed protein product [Adineta steineri]
MVKYLLTGVTGRLGSHVLKHFLRLVPPSDIAVVVRDPSKLSSEINSSGIEIHQGDFSKPELLDAAFKDTEKLLIISVPSIEHELRVKNHINAIDAAKRAHVKHVYYTSLMFGTDVQGHLIDSVAHVMQAHLDTEVYLAKSGLTYTILREGLYSESYSLYTGFFDHTKDNEVCVPGDGPVAWVCIDDLGEGTAKLMINGGHEQETVLLTGSTSISISSVTDIFAKILHRPINFRLVSVDEYIEFHKRRGTALPYPTGEEDFLRKWATSFKALEKGESAVVDLLLQQVLGRDLVPLEDTLTKLFNSKQIS